MKDLGLGLLVGFMDASLELGGPAGIIVGKAALLIYTLPIRLISLEKRYAMISKVIGF